MDWVANAIALGCSVLSLVVFFRWIGAQMVRASDPALASAKRNYVLAILALLVLAAVGIAIVLVAMEPDPMGAAMLGLGAFLAGIVPIIYWMMLNQVRFMGLEGEGAIELSAETRRALRVPMASGIVIGFAAATLMIWLGGRVPPVFPHEFIALGAAVLVVGAVGWPLTVLRQRLAEDRRHKTAQLPLSMRE